jgi:hypothetical protein
MIILSTFHVYPFNTINRGKITRKNIVKANVENQGEYFPPLPL